MRLYPVPRKFLKATQRYRNEAFAIKCTEHAGIGAAHLRRFFQHRLEHRDEVARRRVYHLQHFSGRGLLLQRLLLLCQ